MRQLWDIFATVFKFSWRIINFIRQFIFNAIFFVLLFLVIGAYSLLQTDSKPEKNYFGALVVDLQGIVVDQVSSPDPFGRMSRELLGSSNNLMQENSLFDIVDTIRTAANDDRITGLILRLDNLVSADQPSMAYIGKAIEEFKASGKSVYAMGDSYTQAQYYLASFADEIYLAPHGTVGIYGFSTDTLYYKSLLEKLKVSSHIFRVGTYKSAVEPMMRDNMSPEAREANLLWLTTLWDNYLGSIAQNRKTQAEHIFPGADKLIAQLRLVKGDTAQYALQQKLVDKIYTREQAENVFSNQFGWNKDDKTFNGISIYDYSTQIADTSNSEGNIAVIVVQGAIMDGPQTPGIAGGETLAAQIRDARLNDNIKAIVLRVNSPGGSVSASDLIRNELAAARAAKKPVVVSMGGMAASGGYWISTPADYIIASPSTLTGSIGIFGVINTFENSLESIGVYTDGVSTSPLAGVSVTKGISPQFADMMQITIENGYQTFIGLVAQSRHKTPEEIDKIAQGRVWIGKDALKIGLVDQLGDFDDAVAKAAELAQVKSVELDWMQPELSFMDQLILEVTNNVQVMMPDALQAFLPPAAVTDIRRQAQFFLKMNDPQNRYAFCLNCAEIN
ncbi:MULTISPECIES: signal peptide peptidase SppA [Providencia]|uniref:Signal peptide peptidase SppA, 67K type n=1 Tax=Providencia alcalifaciens DSM 30120 TaxID=520999 RepID=B6XEN0_9GAMM|nr:MULTISPECIES: signal peptide peptidase SppA [Providencia]ATG17372.1 signal peptide peptidase SppA [Providencia alcalifaciens]EEB45968.1 signal peptide peptidase SppA, 67K type [Providencia alcalifaciens DSM 30120]EKT66676.1 protease 4 [Providencia alcalifaciens Dmel2]EUD02162.1 signal peptide peptidase SppA, 67K type [Providencia alcalifaciens RIMD 1656011]EUD08179.1 signal peptide peptidase SppA, 67K type [Providencia alcalifaciens R90-1475]